MEIEDRDVKQRKTKEMNGGKKKSTTYNVTTEARAGSQQWGQLNIFYHGI